MPLDPTIIEACRVSADRLGIEHAAMLAVVQIESGGRPFEPDGTTPRFLFEKHVFWRELGRISGALQTRAEQEGLAVSKWVGDYRDQRTPSDRLALLRRARLIDTEAANRSCSWGLGQILGANAMWLGYTSATAMAQEMSAGVAAQVEAMERFLRARNLAGAINGRDWVAVAEAYNGKQQARHNYSGRLREAYLRWRSFPPAAVAQRSGSAQPGNSNIRAGSSGDKVSAIQRTLEQLVYPVGKIDGIFGPVTQKAVFLYQRMNGLTPTGVVDAATLAALAAGKPMVTSDARRSATVNSLRALGSATIAAADRGKLYAGGLGGVGAIGLLESILGRGGETAGPFGAMLQAALGAVSGAPALEPLVKVVPLLLGPGHGLPFVAAGLGYMIWRTSQTLVRERLDDHRTGVNRAR